MDLCTGLTEDNELATRYVFSSISDAICEANEASAGEHWLRIGHALLATKSDVLSSKGISIIS
jgi:hypothetical protein